MEDTSNQCGICFNGFADPVTLVFCGHRFCKLCLSAWEATGSSVCPECQISSKEENCIVTLRSLTTLFIYTVKRPQQLVANSSGSPSTIAQLKKVVKISLPPLPLPSPHEGMMVLYRAEDEDVPRQDVACELNCYIGCFNPGRRFFYCDNCSTALHRLDFKTPQEIRNNNMSAPLTQMLQNPTAKASMALETQQRQRESEQLHQLLLGHALTCQSEHCGYKTCHLIQVRA